eukprot:scaffold69309_cov65-Phaeocystis_antarctica.AAC.4
MPKSCVPKEGLTALASRTRKLAALVLCRAQPPLWAEEQAGHVVGAGEGLDVEQHQLLVRAARVGEGACKGGAVDLAVAQRQLRQPRHHDLLWRHLGDLARQGHAVNAGRGRAHHAVGLVGVGGAQHEGASRELTPLSRLPT